MRPCRARRPLRCGAETAPAADLVTARVTASIGGAEWLGLASEWAWPGESGAEALLAAVRTAGAAFGDHVGGTAFGIWRDVHGALLGAAPEDAPERRLRGLAVALVERALLDAACRAAGVSLRVALRAHLLGFLPEAVHPELRGWNVAASLPPDAPARLRVRHAVPLDGALRANGAGPGHHVDDALEPWIERHGVTSFELELSGDPRADARRLFDVALLLAGRRVDEVTLDARGGYADPAELARVLDALATTPEGEALCARLLCVKDPLPRARALDPAHCARLAALPAPAVLDEADHGLEAVARALDRGYRGVSARSSKGVFRTLLERGLCAARDGFQLAGDRASVPILQLHQDLALFAALGCEHAALAGHRLFRGLDHLDELERAVALAHHPELYAGGRDGAGLRIEGGLVDVSRADAEPGYASAPAHAAER